MDFPRLPSNVLVAVLGCMSLKTRFICALVCKAWAEAATRSIKLLQARADDLCALQHWLEVHGSQVELLQLHACKGAALTALPCCARVKCLADGISSNVGPGTRSVHTAEGPWL